MALEVDAARDCSLDVAPLLAFPSSPEEERAAREAVAFAYLGASAAASSAAAVAFAFPGPNPISMDVDAHLPTVAREGYVVSPKVDGTRFQLVCLLGFGTPASGTPASATPTVVLVDRTLRCFTPTYFSLDPGLFRLGSEPNAKEATTRRLHCAAPAGPLSALLDVELAAGQLFAFDAVVLGGDRAVAGLPYPERLRALGEAVRGGELGFGAATLLPLRAKPVFPKARAREMMLHPERFLPGVAVDGVVLTPEADPVRTFRHWRMFKVKERHTIDVRLVLVPKAPLRPLANPILAMPESIVQRIRSNVFAPGPGPSPADAPDPSAAAPRTRHAASLLSILGSRKRKAAAVGSEGASEGRAERVPKEATTSIQRSLRGASAASPEGGPTFPPPPLAPAAGHPSRGVFQRSGPSNNPRKGEVKGDPSAPAPPPPSRAPAAVPVPRLSQWILRLEYVRGGRVLDATTDGLEYAGHKILFRVVDTPALSALIDAVEQVWLGVEEDVMTMGLIAEVALTLRAEDLDTPHYEVSVPVTVDRARPDKDEPNSYMTITRTLTSILHGVRAEHLASLEVGGAAEPRSLWDRTASRSPEGEAKAAGAAAAEGRASEGRAERGPKEAPAFSEWTPKA